MLPSLDTTRQQLVYRMRSRSLECLPFWCCKLTLDGLLWCLETKANVLVEPKTAFARDLLRWLVEAAKERETKGGEARENEITEASTQIKMKIELTQR